MLKFIFMEHFKLLTILLAISVFWQGLEVFIDGRITPRTTDSIIAFILALSIYCNIKMLDKLRNK